MAQSARLSLRMQELKLLTDPPSRCHFLPPLLRLRSLVISLHHSRPKMGAIVEMIPTAHIVDVLWRRNRNQLVATTLMGDSIWLIYL
ncbi:hypothetical protein LguiB_024544 [Lonicera macranthoides]